MRTGVSSLKYFAENITKPKEYKPITTPEMEVAIMKYLNVRVNLIVPNVSWGLLDYEADIVSLTKSGYATEVEIKVSVSDLKADFRKPIQHDSNLFKYFYYAVPEDMKEIALELIPDRAGLFVVYHNEFIDKHLPHRVREAKVNPDHRKWTEKERIKLAELGCMRLLGMKEKLLIREQQEASR